MRWEDGSIWKKLHYNKVFYCCRDVRAYKSSSGLPVINIIDPYWLLHTYISVLACLCFLIWAHLNINYKGCNIERKLGIIYKYLISSWSVKKVLKYQYWDCLTNIGIRPKTGSISWVWVRTEMIIPTDHDSYRNHNICRNNNNMIL